MNIDMSYQQTTLSPPAIERRIRYDPNQKCFLRPSDTLNFSRTDHLDFSVAEFIQGTVTAYSIEPLLESINDFIRTHGTAVKLNSSMWSKLPTITDYLDLDSLYDLEETENTFYQATTQQGW